MAETSAWVSGLQPEASNRAHLNDKAMAYLLYPRDVFIVTPDLSGADYYFSRAEENQTAQETE